MWMKKLRKLIIPKGVISQPDQVNVVEVPSNLGKHDSLVVKRQGNRLVAQILPGFHDNISLAKEVYEDDLCLTLSEQNNKASERSVRFEVSGSRSRDSNAFRDYRSGGSGSGSDSGNGPAPGGAGLRRYQNMENLNESSFDPKFSSTPKPYEWSATYGGDGTGTDSYSGSYNPFASSLINTPEPNVTYSIMCTDKPPQFQSTRSRISGQSSSGPGSEIHVDTDTEANIELTNSMLRNAMKQTQDVLTQQQQSYERPSAAVSEPGGRAAPRTPRAPRQGGACLPPAGSPPMVNATYPRPTCGVPYQAPPPRVPASTSYARASSPGPGLPNATFVQPPPLNATFSPPPASNATFRQAPCGTSQRPGGANATYQQAPAINATYRQASPANATFQQGSPPCGPSANATFRQAPAANATFQQGSSPCGPAANATYRQAVGANATFQQGRAPGGQAANATYRQAAPANATFQQGNAPCGPAANATYRQAAPANATFQQGGAPCGPATNATYRQAAPANATFQQGSAPRGPAANATYRQAAAGNATFQQGGAPCGPAANETYRQAPAANATYQQAPINATYQQAPAVNATYQQAANATGPRPSTPCAGTTNLSYQTVGSGYSSSEYSSCQMPVPLEDRRYHRFEAGNVLSSSRMSDYDSADPKNFPAFQHHRRQVYGPSYDESAEPEEDSMDDEAFAAVMDGRFNVITPMTPPRPPIPTGKNKTISHQPRQAPTCGKMSKSYDPPRVLKKQQKKEMGEDCCCSDDESDQVLSYVSSIRHDDYFDVTKGQY